jgi:hypothetical protein
MDVSTTVVGSLGALLNSDREKVGLGPDRFKFALDLVLYLLPLFLSSM